jgi:peptide/nickel transport system substrate-binding protein
MWPYPSSRAMSVRALLSTALIGSSAVFAPGIATAKQSAAASTFVDSGTMTVVADATAVDLDPASDENYGSDNIARNIDDELVANDHASISKFFPKLAVSWSSNPDQSVWTFHLRHGVKFHTGRCCLTATDVQYSISRTIQANLSASYLFSRFISNPTKQITVVDPYTVQFSFSRGTPLLLNALAGEFTALILDSQALKAHATKSDPWAHSWATTHDLGTGPYTIQSWEHGQQTVLVRFPEYWGGWSGRHFSKIIVNTVPESATRRELVEKGKADITYNLTPQDNMALSHNSSVVVSPNYSTEIDYFVMTESGPLASPFARQAVSYAFNYDALINGFYHGFARRSYGPIPSSLLGFDPHAFHYHTDLNKARELFQKAGVKPGTTLTFTYNDPFQPVGLILQAQLAQLGITVKLQHLDNAAFFNIFFGSSAPSSRPNMMPYPWWPDYNDPYDMAVTLVGSQYAGAAGANAGYYHNKQVDTLLAAMKNESGESLVRDAHALQDITSRVDPPAVYLAEPAQVNVMAKSLKGFVYNPLQIRTFYYYWFYR